jgi:hypothetical protein
MWLDRRDPAALVAPWIWDHVEPSALDVTGDGRLVIHAPNAYADLLHALTQPSLALGRGPGTPWPLGTRGSLRGEPAPRETKVEEIVWKRGTRSAAAASEITFRVMEEASPTEVAAAGADAFFVRDRKALDYLEGLEGYDVTALPYSRLYVLLTPEPDIVGKIEPNDLEKLLPIAIGDARLPENADGYLTEAPKSRDKPKAADSRIVVPWWDRDARAIASQLSAIWREKSRKGYPVTLPKKQDEFYRHVLEGKDALYVFPVYPALPSAELQRLLLMRSAPWLAERGGSIALFETRGHLVTRKGLAGFSSGHDGFPRLANAGWEQRPVP